MKLKKLLIAAAHQLTNWEGKKRARKGHSVTWALYEPPKGKAQFDPTWNEKYFIYVTPSIVMPKCANI